MKIQEIRRENLRSWVKKNGAPRGEKSYFSQLLSGIASMGERAARRLEKDYRMGEGFLDTYTGDGANSSFRMEPKTDLRLGNSWPFSTPYEWYELLLEEKKLQLDAIVKAFIEGARPLSHTVSKKNPPCRLSGT